MSSNSQSPNSQPSDSKSASHKSPSSAKPRKSRPLKSSPPSRSRLLWILGALGVVVGGGSAYWFLLHSRIFGSGALPTGAHVIPQDALMVLSVSTDTNQWQRLRKLGTTSTQGQFEKTLAGWQGDFPCLGKEGEMTYEADIKPWIGREVTVAFLSVLDAGTSGTSTGTPTETPAVPPALGRQAIALVLPIANPAKAQALADQATGWTKRTYKETEIQEKQEGTQTCAVAVLDRRFLVASNNPRATESIIDAVEEKKSIQDLPGYRNAANGVKAGNPLAKLFINVPVAAQSANVSAKEAIAPESLEQAQQTQGVAATATLDGNTLRVRGTNWLKANSKKPHTVSNAAKDMANRLPDSTLMMVSGGNLQQLWTDYVAGAKANPLAPINPENLQKGLKSRMGLDLDGDVLSWMKGEFTLALVSLPQEANTPFGAGLVFMVKSSDRPQAEKTLKALDTVIKERYKFTVGEETVASQKVMRWRSPEGGVRASHGWLEGDVAFLAFEEPVVQSFLPRPANSLASSAPFQSGVPKMSPNNGHFFLNLDELRKTGQRSPVPQPFLFNDEAVLPAIQSIGVTASVKNSTQTRYDILVRFHKGDGPVNAPPATPPANDPSSPPSESPANSDPAPAN